MRRCARLLFESILCFQNGFMIFHIFHVCVLRGLASVPEVLEPLRLELPRLESQGPKSRISKKNMWLY